MKYYKNILKTFFLILFISCAFTQKIVHMNGTYDLDGDNMLEFLSLEINLSIIAAVLTIVGYSMNDTVVIYDRIRENLGKFHKLDISDIANLSINETLARTIITSVTTLLALFSIFILGGEILRGFSFAMILGVLIGTYSSIFVASPILKYFKVSYKTIAKEEEKIVP